MLPGNGPTIVTELHRILPKKTEVLANKLALELHHKLILISDKDLPRGKVMKFIEDLVKDKDVETHKVYEYFIELRRKLRS